MATTIEELARHRKPHVVMLRPGRLRPPAATVDRQPLVHRNIELRTVSAITQPVNVVEGESGSGRPGQEYSQNTPQEDANKD
jgi:hypothetical protein